MAEVRDVEGDSGAESPERARWKADWEASVREEIEILRMWSGALPAIVSAPARPWNGRWLTPEEKRTACMIYHQEDAQAALEWLSENAW